MARLHYLGADTGARHRPAAETTLHLIEAADASLLDLTCGDLDFDQIEEVFANLNALLRTAAVRTTSDLHAAVCRAFAGFTLDECRNYPAAAGFDVFVLT